jgi:hypothetical protein
MQKANTWKEQMGYYRFWKNKKITEEELKDTRRRKKSSYWKIPHVRLPKIVGKTVFT